MDDVKPWEPMTLRYVEKENDGNETAIDWPWGKDDFLWLETKKGCAEWLPALVVLANGQKIVVRPLSKEREEQRDLDRTWGRLGRAALKKQEAELKEKGLLS